MKYLKRFNEGNITPELTTEMVDELRSFCRDHLAYLIDEDFKVQVVPLFNGTSCDISFFKEGKLSNFNSYDLTVDWSSIKDQFIPFLYMLNKEYRIIESPDDDSTNRGRFVIQPHQVERIISEKAYPSKIERLRIRVEFKDQSITEAVTQDVIELCCVDLFDEDFELSGYNKTGNTLVSLQKRIVSQLDQWDGQETDTRPGVIWDSHLSKYQPGTITITGENFDKVETSFRQTCGWDRSKPLTFTDEENKLISQVINAASLLRHYSDVDVRNGKLSKRTWSYIEIHINSGGIQNPMNFQYERYQTRIEITFYL